MKKYLVLLIVLILFMPLLFLNKKEAYVSAASAVAVHTVTAAPQPLPYKYNTIGTVVPLQEVVVQPQVSGKLTDILFNEGDMVTEGRIIAKIDDASAEAELDRTEAELAVNQAKLHEAETNLKRYKQLRKGSVVSQKALEESESVCRQLRAAVMSSKAQVEIARINYDHTKITAPISGRIGLKSVNKGNIVSASDNRGIATIVQISPISVIFSLPQRLLSVLAHNQNAVVEIIDNTSGEKLSEGKVSAFDNTINEQNGTVKIRANFDNNNEKLWPGQSVNVNLIYGQNKYHIVLSNKIVRPGANGSYVFKFSGGKAEIVPVETGYSDENNIVILSGIKAGDMIITDGFSALTDGTPVKLIEGE